MTVELGPRPATPPTWAPCASATIPREPTVARDLVLRYGAETVSYQILNPGIAHWLTPDRTAVVGYVAAGGTWVAVGTPLSAPERQAEVVAAFEAAAAQAGQRVCYFGVQAAQAAPFAGTAPLARLQIGAQPVWQPQAWPRLVARTSALRAQIARARNKGLVVRRWPAAVAARDAGLRACLSQWLHQRGLPPLGFLVEPDALAVPEDRHVFVALNEQRPLAYLVATPIPQRTGWLVEQLVRGSDVPNGTAELLLDTTMRTLASEGAHLVTLGLTPLARHGADPDAPPPCMIGLLLEWVRTYGQRFYNFAGLEAFRSRLHPDGWEPVYLLSRERETSLQTLYAVASAFSGGRPWWFVSQAALSLAAAVG